MGRRAKVDVIEGTPGVEAELDSDLSDLSGEERDALKAILELEGAQDARWKIFRVPPLPPGKAAGFCETLSSAELSMEEIRNRFGRGKYRVQGTRSDGKFIKQVTFDIATDSTALTVVPAASDNKDFFARMEERELRAQERRDKMMELVIPGALGAITALMTSLAGRQQSDPIQMIAALKTLTPQQPDMTSLIVKILDIAKDGSGSSDPPWLGLAKDAIGQFAPLLTSKIESMTQPASSTPTAIVPQIAAPQQSIPEGEPAMVKLILWARQTLAFLVQKAAANKDAGLYADYILDNVPPGVDIRQFAAYLVQENWWEVLQQFDKGVAPYQGWFAQFRDFLIDALEEQDVQINATQNDSLEIPADSSLDS